MLASGDRNLNSQDLAFVRADKTESPSILDGLWRVRGEAAWSKRKKFLVIVGLGVTMWALVGVTGWAAIHLLRYVSL